MSRRAAFVMVLALSLGALLRAGAASAPASVKTDADWLLAVQTTEGIITQGIDRTWCVPYFANIGARGLARAYAVTKDARYSNAAWSWLLWYQAHMNSSGFVTDYRLTNGTWQSTGDFDSTDSYAATFLSALDDLWNVTSDTVRLTSLRIGVMRAISAMDATTDSSDSLTYAKPGWGWKYLMDAGEVFEGWKAAADLAGALNDVITKQKAVARANKIATSIKKLANTPSGGYDWALSDIGAHAKLDWGQFYPSATAQAWLVFPGLSSTAAAQPILNKLDVAQPTWDKPFSQGVIVDRRAPIGYWPEIARAFLQAGLRARARAGLASIEAAADSAKRFWPFHPGTAGALILLAADPRLLLADVAAHGSSAAV